MQYGEVCRHRYHKHEYWCDEPVDAKRDKQIKEYHMQRVVDNVAKTETCRLLHSDFGAKREIGGKEEVANETYYVSDGIGDAQPHASPVYQLQKKVNQIMNTGSYHANDTESDELP